MKILPFGHTPSIGGDTQLVKGISRQVILVHAPETQLFEQAIFILKDNAQGVTDEMLLSEAKKIINSHRRVRSFPGPVWACFGAITTGIIWLVTIFL